MTVVIQGDARYLPLIKDESIQCVVTSPPYFGLRCYGDDEMEIGRDDLNTYLADMEAVGAEMWRVLDETGTWWLNIGDTAAGSGGAGGDYNRKGSKEGLPKYKQGESGIPAKNWMGVPERVMLRLQDAGWTVRSKIVWDKKNLRPESAKHVRRPGIQHEMIYMLVKHPKNYYFNHEAMDEPGDVWHLPPVHGARRHMAPFPEEIPYRCIRMSTQPGDVVLDPFMGSGTTLYVARDLDRGGIGVDLYPVELDDTGRRPLEEYAERSAMNR